MKKLLLFLVLICGSLTAQVSSDDTISWRTLTIDGVNYHVNENDYRDRLHQYFWIEITSIRGRRGSGQSTILINYYEGNFELRTGSRIKIGHNPGGRYHTITGLRSSGSDWREYNITPALGGSVWPDLPIKAHRFDIGIGAGTTF